MLSFSKIKIVLVAIIAVPIICIAQPLKQATALQRLAVLYKAKEQKDYDNLMLIAKQKGWDLVLKSIDSNKIILLTGIDSKGFPVYTQTDNNTTSAATTHTNYLWQNGFNLSGSSANMKGKIAIWDGGAVNNNHIEINGRAIVKDLSGVASHSTHVAGTMIATGANPTAKGMAFGSEQILSYNFNNHISEMASQASNLLLSNHSYGNTCGWNKLGNGDWIFNGNTGDTADYKFGIYNEETQLFDSIAFNAPYYLIVKSSGNNRDQNGPTVGQPYKIYDNGLGQYVDAGNRPVGMSSNNGYDIIPTYGCAKNILTVGAVEGIISGSVKIADIKMSSFSNYGPTDDGRIKPDLVAAGVDVISCTDAPSSYGAISGTSMAAPNVTGSLFLLQELYSKKNNSNFMKAASIKALAIHTANESGDADGPDYKFGWGLLNAEKAANIIAGKDTAFSKIIETTLNNNDTFKLNVVASGNGKLMATIVWTDIVGEPTTTNLLNNPSLKLINDLDIRIIKDANTYFPWVLNPAVPSLAATKADNFRDNVERIEIDNAIPGETYTIQITHKATLQRGSQNFSLIVNGIGGSIFCKPLVVNNNSVKVDSFRFANIFNASNTCNNYDNNTNAIAFLQPGKIYNLNIGLSNCNATGNNKIAKLYVDYNNNGSFADANELAFTSNAVVGIGTVNANIAILKNIIIGNTTLMRLVVAETTVASAFDACTLASLNGTIQDYSVKFIAPEKDIAVNEISLPATNFCANNVQYISVRITNNGDIAVENIPLTAIVKNAGATVATMFGNYAPKLFSGESVVYTFQNPFITIADSTYAITVFSSLSNDQNSTNDTIVSAITIKSKPSTVNGSADICNNIATLKLFGTNDYQSYAWYSNATSNLPVATGSNTSTTTISNKYYVSTGVATTLGAVNKNISATGDYQINGRNYFTFIDTVPVLLQSAKLYTAYPGKITITVADIKAVFPNGTYTYNTLSSTTINVLASRPAQQTGNVSGNDVADTGLVYNINLLLPKGKHAIIVTTDSIANIFRNNKVAANPYPYNIPGIISITGNNATNPDSFYYYLYNMQVKTLDCVSDKVAVIPTVVALPTITKLGDTLVSSLGVNYQWQKDGVDIARETNQVYKPIAAGNYTVVVTDFGGCRQSSNVYKPASSGEISIYPNPAKNIVNIAFESDENATTQIYVYDVLGRACLAKAYSASSNSFSDKLDIASISSGIYFIKIVHGNKNFAKKLVVIK